MAARVALGETGPAVRLERQFPTCSDPAREPRRHTPSTVSLADAGGGPREGVAAEARVLPVDGLPGLVFDHAQIAADYRAGRC